MGSEPVNDAGIEFDTAGWPPLVLASGSRYRAAMLAGSGVRVSVDPPDIDERSADGLLHDVGPDGLALELARRKAAAVVARHPGAWVIAADQVGVLGQDRTGASETTVRMLTKQPDVTTASAQLMAMSGTEHRLVNGLVVLDADSGRRAEGVDVQRVRMRSFSVEEARSYVERFEPFDCSGSYRLEDQEEMDPSQRLVTEVVGEHDSGVLGLPLPLLGRLFAELRTAH